MKKTEVKFVILVSLSFLVTTPSYARGFSGGFSGGFGGGHFGGGMSSNFGSGGLRNGGFRNSGGDGGFRNSGAGDGGFRNSSFGDGGFRNSGAGDGGFRNSGFGDGGFRNGGFRNLPTDGGFGKISGLQNRNPQKLSQNDLSNQGKSVRDSFNNNNLNKTTNNQFNQYNYNRYGGYGYHPYGYGGYGWGYPAAWYPAGLTASMWTCTGMESLDTFLGLAALENNSSKSSQPASSNNVVYEGDNVYIDGQPGVTSEQYYQQSQQLALAGQDNSQYTDSTNSSGSSAQWQPLGVFALAEPGQSQSNMLLQLAIDKNGIVHGNYYNQLTNESAEVYGSLDKKTQRVSWTIGTNPNTVFDAGLGDLVKDDSSVLVHYGPNNTSRMALIRLQQPSQGAATS